MKQLQDETKRMEAEHKRASEEAALINKKTWEAQ